MRHILAAGQFSTQDIAKVFSLAEQMRGLRLPSSMLAGKTLACLFYEPSTRTSSSFIAAMTKLGGGVIPITQGVQFSSVSKGETLEDTIRTLGQYADAIVLRHPETGAAQRAADVSPVPIINAGDGIGEHPTQALLDLFTIQQEIGRLEKLHIAFVGDLAYGRTVHSLAHLLSLYPGNKFSLVSPWSLRLNKNGDDTPLYRAIQDRMEVYHVEKGLYEAREALREADIVYMTRVQKERFSWNEGYVEVKDSCLLTPELVEGMKPNARILHPLPRVNEIPREIDDDPRAAYFRQVKAGLYVRMALLSMTLGLV